MEFFSKIQKKEFKQYIKKSKLLSHDKIIDILKKGYNMDFFISVPKTLKSVDNIGEALVAGHFTSFPVIALDKATATTEMKSYMGSSKMKVIKVSMDDKDFFLFTAYLLNYSSTRICSSRKLNLNIKEIL